MISVCPEDSDLFSAEKSVSDFLSIPSEIVRRFKNRTTGRFVRQGRAFYIKVHRPGGWRPVAEDLLRLRRPQIGARSEWRALEELRRLGIFAPRVVAYGEEGTTPASQRSFLITEEIAETISLETLAEGGQAAPIGSILKRRLIRRVARIARTLHQNGLNHRDFYLCHFLLTVASMEAEPQVYLIDLHRAQKRSVTPRRWILKDLGGLLFSAMDVDLTPRDLALFVTTYAGVPFREAIEKDQPFWRAVVRNAERLYRKIHHKRPRLDPSTIFDRRTS